MIKDITLGQYFPGNSIVHKLDARIKIILTGVFIVLLFSADSIWGLCVGIAFTIITFAITKIPAKLMGKCLKPIVPIIVFTALLNIFFIKSGDPYFEWKFIKITDEGVSTAVFMVVRIICLIVGTSLLTYTTSPIDLTDAIERLLSPLKKIKVPVHELAMMMTIALRFIPTLIEETDKIMSAQKARGGDMETGSIIKRAKAM
ncbi:MAG: energy-coupling factor transporter transmembrane component T family protein, partial [Hominimerdicola sp.]